MSSLSWEVTMPFCLCPHQFWNSNSMGQMNDQIYRIKETSKQTNKHTHAHKDQRNWWKQGIFVTKRMNFRITFCFVLLPLFFLFSFFKKKTLRMHPRHLQACFFTMFEGQGVSNVIGGSEQKNNLKACIWNPRLGEEQQQLPHLSLQLLFPPIMETNQLKHQQRFMKRRESLSCCSTLLRNVWSARSFLSLLRDAFNVSKQLLGITEGSVPAPPQKSGGFSLHMSQHNSPACHSRTLPSTISNDRLTKHFVLPPKTLFVLSHHA